MISFITPAQASFVGEAGSLERYEMGVQIQHRCNVSQGFHPCLAGLGSYSISLKRVNFLGTDCVEEGSFYHNNL